MKNEKADPVGVGLSKEGGVAFLAHRTRGITIVLFINRRKIVRKVTRFFEKYVEIRRNT
jgi:hypothetical protein